MKSKSKQLLRLFIVFLSLVCFTPTTYAYSNSFPSESYYGMQINYSIQGGNPGTFDEEEYTWEDEYGVEGYGLYVVKTVEKERDYNLNSQIPDDYVYEDGAIFPSSADGRITDDTVVLSVNATFDPQFWSEHNLHPDDYILEIALEAIGENSRIRETTDPDPLIGAFTNINQQLSVELPPDIEYVRFLIRMRVRATSQSLPHRDIRLLVSGSMIADEFIASPVDNTISYESDEDGLPLDTNEFPFSVGITQIFIGAVAAGVTGAALVLILGKKSAISAAASNIKPSNATTIVAAESWPLPLEGTWQERLKEIRANEKKTKEEIDSYRESLDRWEKSWQEQDQVSEDANQIRKEYENYIEHLREESDQLKKAADQLEGTGELTSELPQEIFTEEIPDYTETIDDYLENIQQWLSPQEMENLTGKNWRNLDDRERERMVSRLSNELANTMDYGSRFEIKFDPDYDYSGSMDSRSDPPKMIINSSGEDWDCPMSILNTVTHELRHLQQYKQTVDPGIRSLGSEAADQAARLNTENYIHVSEDPVGYYNQFKERDAEAFGQNTANKINESAYLNKLDRMLKEMLPRETYEPGSVFEVGSNR